MSNNSEKKLIDSTIVPLKELLIQVAKGVAEAQKALDMQSFQFQKDIYADPELESLRNAGIESTWYQIPEVHASLKVAISMHSESDSSDSNISKSPFKLRLAPYNALYKNSFDYDYKGASEMKFKIVPVPPPSASTFTIVPNLIGKTKDEALIAIGEASLKLGNISEKESQTQVGTVIEQNPEPESEIKIGEPVDIILSKQ